jgi:hypothetical protein
MECGSGSVRQPTGYQFGIRGQTEGIAQHKRGRATCDVAGKNVKTRGRAVG